MGHAPMWKVVLKMTCFKELAFILVSEDYLELPESLELLGKLHLFLPLTFLWVHDNGKLLESIY